MEIKLSVCPNSYEDTQISPISEGLKIDDLCLRIDIPTLFNAPRIKFLALLNLSRQKNQSPREFNYANFLGTGVIEKLNLEVG